MDNFNAPMEFVLQIAGNVTTMMTAVITATNSIAQPQQLVQIFHLLQLYPLELYLVNECYAYIII